MLKNYNIFTTKCYISLTIFIFCTFSAFSQLNCYSGTVNNDNPTLLFNRSVINQVSLESSYCVKIYMHVIRDFNGNGGQPVSRVHLAALNLNAGFNQYNIYFEWDGEIDYPVTITPQQINEAAAYNWYDPEGTLIHQGTSLTVTAAMAKKYTFEVIADSDGFKDYDEVEVSLRPSRITSISPNPLTQNELQINYKLNNVGSAYFMIVDQNSGVSQNYILSNTTTTTILNLNTYTAGLYTIALVCDSEIVDAKTFIKQ